MGLVNALLASALALGVAVFGLVCRRPALLHGLWLLVLLKLVTPPLVRVSLPWPEETETAGVQPAARENPEAEPFEPRRERPAGADLSRRQLEPERDVALLPPPNRASSGRVHAKRLAAQGPLREKAPERPSVSVRADAGPPQFPWPVVLLTIWLGGCLAWWTVAAYRITRFRALLRHAHPAPPPLRELARKLAERLGLAYCPRIDLVEAPISPLLWALGRTPRLLLPVALWDRLSAEQQESLMAHELAHLRRRDHWVRRLELVVLGFYWWHPVAWWTCHRLRDAEEQCCDAWVVWALPAASPAYASALVETVAFLSLHRTVWPLAASGAGHVQTLKRRLTMILRGTPPRALSGPGLLAVLALGSLVLPLLPTPAEPPAREKPNAAPVRTSTPDRPRIEKTEKPTAPEKALDRLAADKDPEKQLALDRPVDRPAAEHVTSRTAAPETSEETPESPKTSPYQKGRQGQVDSVEALTDEIELLEAQMDAKKAELEEEEIRVDVARRNLTRLSNLGKAVSEGEISKARAEVQIHQARLAGKRAQLREVEIRLKQARRRLVRLQKRPEDRSSRTQPEGGGFAIGPANQNKDFGVVERGVQLTHTFYLVNRGRGACRIASVRTSWAGLTAVPSQNELASGQEMKVVVRLDTRRFRGPRTATAFLVFEPANQTGFRHDLGQEVRLQVRTEFRDTRSDKTLEGTDSAADRDRLEKLEQKLQALRQEVEALRKQKRNEER
jgi:beta-lactamase regulating signal transducer with metallopeptidase domain